jgi:hypothetical protein
MSKAYSVVLLLLISAGCSESSRPTGPAGGTSALRINGVTPSSGLPTASTPIQITGTGFVDGSTLTLDGVATTVTFVTASLLRATAPPHAAGPITVAVRNPNGQVAELRNGFRYEVALTSLTLSGNLSLRSVGETSQLTATAVYADGSTADVTTESRWTVALSGVATITSGGLLTAVGLGRTPVSVQYPPNGPSSRFRSDTLAVTPAGTRAVYGRVRQPGAGSIANATIVHQASGQSTTSNDNGYFTFGGIGGSLRLSISKSGFEDVDLDAGDEETLDIPMQPVVRIDPGAAPRSVTLAPNDVDYLIGGTHCQPCRMIRITSPGSGTVNVTVRWTTSANLHVWSEGQMYDPSGQPREIVVPIQLGGGEKQIYVGEVRQASAGNYISFSVSVSGVQ